MRAQRRGRRRRRARGYDGVLLSPGPGHARRRPASASTWCARSRATCRCSASAWGTRRSRSPTARWSSGPPSCCTARPARCSTRAPACWPGCRRRSPRPATTRWPCEPTTVPAELEVTGAHRQRRRDGAAAPRPAVEGVQFHPESVLTEGGHRMLATWLAACGDPDAPDRAELQPRRRWSGCRRASRESTGVRRVDACRSVRRWRVSTAVGGRCVATVTVDRRCRAGCSPAGAWRMHGAGLGVGRLLLPGRGTVKPACSSSVCAPSPRPRRPRRAPCCCRWRTSTSTWLPAGTVSPSRARPGAPCCGGWSDGLRRDVAELEVGVRSAPAWAWSSDRPTRDGTVVSSAPGGHGRRPRCPRRPASAGSGLWSMISCPRATLSSAFAVCVPSVSPPPRALVARLAR